MYSNRILINLSPVSSVLSNGQTAEYDDISPEGNDWQAEYLYCKKKKINRALDSGCAKAAAYCI